MYAYIIVCFILYHDFSKKNLHTSITMVIYMDTYRFAKSGTQRKQSDGRNDPETSIYDGCDKFFHTYFFSNDIFLTTVTSPKLPEN